MSLYRSWEKAYGLEPDSVSPPEKFELPANLPPAPHLEDCSARTAFRLSAEQRGQDGSAPNWTRPSNCCSCNPQPPWVRGDDLANLALTRVAQRDIWESQFPATCKGRRILLAEWVDGPIQGPGQAAAAGAAAAGGGGAAGGAAADSGAFGMGTQIQVMSAFLSIAVRHNRTLVVAPGTYSRANNSACQAANHTGAWECYFFPISSQECVDEAVAAVAANQATSANGPDMEARLASPDLVVRFADARHFEDVDGAKRWGTPWRDRPSTVEVQGVLEEADEKTMQHRWWHAQSARFLLRWPSAHLCHVINRIRHVSYGLRLAVHISDISAEESDIIQSLEKGTSQSGKGIPDFNMTKEAEFLKGINFAPPNLETDVWPGEGFAGCLVRDTDGETPATLDKTFKGVGGEVFIFRPIVSVHVAHGDAVLEGGGVQGGSFPEGGSRVKLRSLGVYMYFAYQLQLHVPTINHAWLSTDAQSTLEEAKQLRDWSFLYSEHPSQQAAAVGGVAAENGDGTSSLASTDAADASSSFVHVDRSASLVSNSVIRIGSSKLESQVESAADRRLAGAEVSVGFPGAEADRQQGRAVAEADGAGLVVAPAGEGGVGLERAAAVRWRAERQLMIASRAAAAGGWVGPLERPRAAGNVSVFDSTQKNVGVIVAGSVRANIAGNVGVRAAALRSRKLAAAKLPSQKGFVSIDCGYMGSAGASNLGLTWLPDTAAPGGSVAVITRVPDNLVGQVTVEQTLRVFDDAKPSNCYQIPLVAPGRYLVRLTFWYGNYDSKNMPPVFNVTVGTASLGQYTPSNDQILVLEVIVTVPARTMAICLVRVSADPIINALEIRPLPAGAYNESDYSDQLLLNYWRLSCAGDSWLVGSYRYPDDPLDRVWYADMPLFGDPTPGTYTYIPAAASVAVTSSSVTIPASMSSNAVPQFVVQKARTTKSAQGLTYSFYGLAPGKYQLKAEEGSRVKEVGLAGLELYTVVEPKAAVPREQVRALACIKAQMGRAAALDSWTGDPCYPIVWPGIICKTSRHQSSVIGLNLTHLNISGPFSACISELYTLQTLWMDHNQLQGSIPSSIGNLTQLRSIKLNNNKLSGPVPAALAALPNLQYLDLTSNNLSGPFPFNSSSNVQIGISGNINLCSPDASFGLPPCNNTIPPAPSSSPSDTSAQAATSPAAMSTAVLMALILGVIIGVLLVLLASWLLLRWQQRVAGRGGLGGRSGAGGGGGGGVGGDGLGQQPPVVVYVHGDTGAVTVQAAGMRPPLLLVMNSELPKQANSAGATLYMQSNQVLLSPKAAAGLAPAAVTAAIILTKSLLLPPCLPITTPFRLCWSDSLHTEQATLHSAGATLYTQINHLSPKAAAGLTPAAATAAIKATLSLLLPPCLPITTPFRLCRGDSLHTDQPPLTQGFCRGVLPDGRMVAVKRRDDDSLQGDREFVNEVDLLSRACHPNLVELVGYCREARQHLLVYEFMPNGTVREHLYDQMGQPLGRLRWLTRIQIALGAARAIQYLHTCLHPPIIHRDIKTSNILLDGRLNARVADFGLSRVGPQDNRSHVSTVVKGTAGYLDPEYFTIQQLTDRSDVFSFGVVLLELISGQQPIDLNRPQQHWSIIDWAREHLQQGNIRAVADSTLFPHEWDEEAMWRVAEVGMVCVEPKSLNRPPITEVVAELEHVLALEH
ncbi:unnamed protein product [Closterium sp. Yama58-4]|nr:unnamed protein product [Closterium sp. Yama58-4]